MDSNLLIAAVHIVIDLGCVEVADSCRSIEDNRSQVCLDVSDFCGIALQAPKDVLDMLAAYFQKAASYSFAGISCLPTVTLSLEVLMTSLIISTISSSCSLSYC